MGKVGSFDRFDLGQGLFEKLDPHLVYQADAVVVTPASPPLLYVGLTQEILN